MLKAFKRIALVMIVLVIAGLGFVWRYDRTGQRADPDFDPRVERPAYPSGPGGRHPRDWESRQVRYPAVGHVQALALSAGAGRVVISGEAALFTAQVDPLGRRFGMNRTDTDDRQLLLNILHWLSRVDG